jgi:hypothetical protein
MMWQLEASRDHGMVGFFREGSGRRDGFVLPVGQWVHIAATCDGSTARLYLDGQQVVSGPMTFGSNTAAALVFGACEKNGGNPFNGTLDDVQLYYRVLNEQQIQAVLAGYPNSLEPDVEGGLIGWWKLDDGTGTTAIDSSDNGNDGTLRGNPRWVSGKLGGALDFDAVGDYVDCGNSPMFNITDELTVSAWINMHSVRGEWRTIVAKGDSAWRISTNGATRGMHFGFTGAGRNWLRADSVTEIPLNEWHHVCGVYDRVNGARIYINGVQEAVNPDTGGIDTNTHRVYIGENAEAPGRLWDGLIDDVRVYNRALSQEEILDLL